MMQVKEKKDKVVDRILLGLRSPGWDEMMEPLLDSSMFAEIFEKLVKQVDLQYPFYPKVTHWFRFLEECPYKSTKTLIVANLPARWWKFSVGIPFNTMEHKRTIVHDWFEREIRQTCDSHYSVPMDFACWSNQGLIMMPCAITNGNEFDHLELWKPFMGSFADTLRHRFPDIPWVLLGRTGKWFEDFAPAQVLHRPMPINSRSNPWRGDGMFRDINNILLRQGKEDFTW